MKSTHHLSPLIILLLIHYTTALSLSHPNLQKRQSRLLNLPPRLLDLPPRPIYPEIVSNVAKHDLECKSCPYSHCLNSLVVPASQEIPLSCWTQGETIAEDNTWLRYAASERVGDFCYVSTFDLKETNESVRTSLPYCGERSEMNFFLPSIKTRTVEKSECGLCPFGGCEVVETIEKGLEVDVNCVVFDGSQVKSDKYPDGTRKYYRTNDNCYVSLSTVDEILTPAIPLDGTPPTYQHFTEIIPTCGPIPHLNLAERPVVPKPSQAKVESQLPADKGLQLVRVDPIVIPHESVSDSIVETDDIIPLVSQ